MDDEKECPAEMDLDNLPPGVTVMKKMPDGSAIPEGVVVIEPGAATGAGRKLDAASGAAMLTMAGAAALGHSGMGVDVAMLQKMCETPRAKGERRLSIVGPSRNMKKQRRNAPCGCGSDKKAKKCCGDYPKAQREL